MSSSLSMIPRAPEGPGTDGHSSSHQQPRRQADPATETPAPPAEDPGQRLVIEETAEGGLVYTVIDRASGAVVVKSSREDVAQLAQRPGYAAGAFIRAKA